MTLNPEFRRNLWIELRLHRLIAMPVAVALVTALLATLDSSLGLLHSGALVGYYGVVFLWGARRAGAAVAEEVNGRTWEMQRMTALGAWSMAWGKIFGSTAFVWYGGLMILAVFCLAPLALGHLPSQGALIYAATEIATGVLVHAVAVAVSLVLLAKLPRGRTLPVTFSQMIGIAAVLAMAWWPGFGLTLVPAWQALGSVVWYGVAVPTQYFALASAVAFAAWAVFGVYRLLRAELQFEGAPWGWPAFTLFLIAYLCGFAPEVEVFGARAWLLLGFFVSLGATYIAVFADDNGLLRYRAMLSALGAGRPARALRRLPRWVPSVLLLILFAVAVAVAADFDRVAVSGMEFRALEAELGRLSRIWVAAVVLFALRDILFVLLLNAGRHRRRPDMTAFIYLLLLYGPVLWLLELVAPQLAGLVAALPVQSSLVSVIAGAAQAAALAVLLWRAWTRPLAAPAGERPAPEQAA